MLVSFSHDSHFALAWKKNGKKVIIFIVCVCGFFFFYNTFNSRHFLFNGIKATSYAISYWLVIYFGRMGLE